MYYLPRTSREVQYLMTVQTAIKCGTMPQFFLTIAIHINLIKISINTKAHVHTRKGNFFKQSFPSNKRIATLYLTSKGANIDNIMSEHLFIAPFN